jgi:hypothetical protein
MRVGIRQVFSQGMLIGQGALIPIKTPDTRDTVVRGLECILAGRR